MPRLVSPPIQSLTALNEEARLVSLVEDGGANRTRLLQ